MSISAISFTASGPSGELLAGGRVVGVFKQWELSASGRWRWTVEARRCEFNDYRVDHCEPPFTVKLSLGKAVPGAWIAEVDLVSKDPLVLRGLSPFSSDDSEGVER